MIVISTNNGKDFLRNLLEDLNNFKITHPISVIDTQSTDIDSINFFNTLKQIFPNLNIQTYTTPTRNFDTGAYMYAINNIIAERYYFLHDSIRIKLPDFFDEIDRKLSPGIVVALTVFPGNNYDYDEQKDLCLKNWNTTEFVTGIFGPMFSILRTDLEKHWAELPKSLPDNKNLQMGMERGWGVFCTKCNLTVVELEDGLNYEYIYTDGFKYFSKLLPRRG